MSFIEFEKVEHKNNFSMNGLHSHAHYEIYFLREGVRTFFLTDVIETLSTTCLIIIPPHVMHMTDGGPYLRYNVNVSPDYLDAYQNDVLSRLSLQCIQLTPEQAAQYEALMEKGSKTDPFHPYGKDILRAIFSSAVLFLGEVDPQKNKRISPVQREIPPLYLNVSDYLNKNYAEKITLQQLAKTFFVAKTTLVTSFKKYLYCSPFELLLQIRLTRSKELLAQTNLSIEEISERCGFSSANYFSLIFKKKEGVSPTNYRKQYLT